MKKGIIFAVTFFCARLCIAQVPIVNNPPDPLGPGIVMSLYGSGLGPPQSCQGFAIPDQHQTPSPLRPQQSSTETAIYPETLCGVQVFVNNTPAGLMYVHERQINFKAPQDTPMSGTGQIRVVYESRPSAIVPVKLGLGVPILSLQGTAYVGLPVWVEIRKPSFHGSETIRYPLGVRPSDFGCQDIELRQNGVLVPRSLAFQKQASAGGVGGAPCGSVSRSDNDKFARRLPLHLQYTFEKSGKYEIRYSETRPAWLPALKDRTLQQSNWTPIEVLPSTPAFRARWFADFTAHPPADAGTLTSDFLPSLMAVNTPQSLRVVEDYLYHPDRLVRTFAMYGLSWWPDNQARDAVLALIRDKGPSEEALWYLRVQKALDPVRNALLEQSLQLLQTGSIVQLTGVFALLREPVDASLRPRLDALLISAKEHVLSLGDAQTSANYAGVLGRAEDPRVHALLWDLIDSDKARDAAASALAWRHDPADLPRLANLTDLPALPNSLRAQYGEAATPYLVALLATGTPNVRISSTRELLLMKNNAAFGFIAESIESNKPWRRDAIWLVREGFPEMRAADEAAILQFAKSRATKPQ